MPIFDSAESSGKIGQTLGITYIKKSIYEAVMSCKTVFIDYIQKMGIDFTHKNLKPELL